MNWDDDTRRVNTVIGRGFMSAKINTDWKMPRAKVTTANGQTVENVDLITFAGFGSNPTHGNKTEVLTLDPNGDPSQRVAIPIGDRKNFRKGKPGEAWLQSPDDKEQYIYASRGR